MVKGSIQIVRNAQYEAQQRTVDVSVKPAIGKSLFSDALMAAASGSFHGHFEVERFVHNQVREYTLRAAARCSDVRAVLPDRKASALKSDSIVPAQEHINVPEAFVYRAVAENIDNNFGSITVPEVPKELRVYVLAKMLHDMDLPLNQVDAISPAKAKINEDRSNLKIRFALKKIAKAAGLPLNTADSERVHLFSKLASAQMSLTDASRRSEDKGILDSDKADKKIWDQTRSAIVVLSLLSRLSKTKGVSSDFLYCPESKTRHHKYAQRDSSTDKNTAELHTFQTRKEEGFGTAPIWYQQSMANGPPEQRLAGTNALLAQG